MYQTSNKTATEARKEWFSLLDQVYYEGKTFYIIKHGNIVAKLAKFNNQHIEGWEITPELALECLNTEIPRTP